MAEPWFSTVKKLTEFFSTDQIEASARRTKFVRNRTPGANTTEPRAEEKSAARAKELGFCRLLPCRPPSSSPTRGGVVGVP